jgi:peptidoglycan/xylan/chitin deacetylase (PgdA/CDA1 family)
MRRQLAIALGAVALLAGGLTGLYHLARSRTTQLLGTLVARVETSERVVALTFDDGPTEAVVDEILSTLASHHARATFFVNGGHVSEAPEVARRLVAAGHELGNHTDSHERMVLRSQAFIRSEIERTDALIHAAGQEGEIYFRPPFCWKLVGLPWFLWRTGRTTITWDIHADSPALASDPAKIVSECVQRVRPGSIILLHIWYPSRSASRAAVPLILDRLQARGYRFVTVRELIALQRPGVVQRGTTTPSARLVGPGPRPASGPDHPARWSVVPANESSGGDQAAAPGLMAAGQP